MAQLYPGKEYCTIKVVLHENFRDGDYLFSIATCTMLTNALVYMTRIRQKQIHCTYSFDAITTEP